MLWGIIKYSSLYQHYLPEEAIGNMSPAGHGGGSLMERGEKICIGLMSALKKAVRVGRILTA